MKNFRSISIMRLQKEYGLTEKNAIKLWRQAYHKTSEIKAGVKAIQAETYYGLFYKDMAYYTHNIDIKNVKVESVKTSKTDESAEFYFKETTIKRLKNFADKYDKVSFYIKQYENNEISYNQLKNYITKFKKTSIDYLSTKS